MARACQRIPRGAADRTEGRKAARRCSQAARRGLKKPGLKQPGGVERGLKSWRCRRGRKRPESEAGSPEGPEVARRGWRRPKGTVGGQEGPEVAWRGWRRPGGARGRRPQRQEAPEAACRRPRGTKGGLGVPQVGQTL